MPTDNDAFLAAIHADPDDIMARLVYADWLDEQGDPCGEWVRLLCEERVNSYGKGSAWKRLEQLCGGLEGIAARLDERPRRHLALDFAEHVLPFYTAEYPRDGQLDRAMNAHRKDARLPNLLELPGPDSRQARAILLRGLQATVTSTVTRCSRDGRTGTPAGGAACYAARATDAAVAWPIGPDRIGNVATYAEWASYDAAEAHGQSGEAARDAEKSWQLCRAVEYLLGFIPPQAITAAE